MAGLITTRGPLLVASVVAFLVTAKAHGRQVRLERERAGYVHVTFRDRTFPPFVEALWKRERVAFWSVALALAAAWVGFVLLGRRVDANAWVLLLPVLLWAPAIAFTVTGVASWVRTGAGQHWVSSAGWWLASLGAMSATAVLWRRLVS